MKVGLGLLGAGSSPKQTTRTSQNQKRDETSKYADDYSRFSGSTPWGASIPYLQSLFGNAENLYARGHNLRSPTNPLLKSYMDQAQNFQADPRITGLYGDTISGRYMNRPQIEGERDIEGMIGRAIDPAIKQYQRQILPGLEVQAAKAGRLGSTNYLDQYNQALSNLDTTVANTAADIAYQDFGERRALETQWQDRERNRQLQSAGMLTDYQNIPFDRLGQGLAAFHEFGPNALRDQSTRLDNLMKYRSIFSGLPTSTFETGTKSGTKDTKSTTVGTGSQVDRQNKSPQQWIRDFGLPFRVFGGGGGGGAMPLPTPMLGGGSLIF